MKGKSNSTKGDISELLQARSEIDEELRRHKITLTILFTDIVGSTGYFERFGDTAGVLLLHRHDNFVIHAVEEFGGTVVKTIGDSVMAEFPGPLPATRAAMSIQEQLLEHNLTVGENEKLQVRAGINSGPGFRRGADVYGDAVNVAARITKLSGGAQILISRSVQQGIAHADIHCRPLGPINLEGKSEPEEVFEVVWGDAEAEFDRLTTPSAKTTSMDLPIPNLDRYKILSRVGSGGTGVVFQAVDRETGEVVALKVLHPRIASDAAHLESFRNEMRVARRITHKNVCRLYDFNRVDGVTFLSMEFVRGDSLRKVLQRFGALGTRKALSIATQICDGLREVHAQGLVHRDLKPENVMVAESGNLKLMDFGLTRPVSAETDGRATGTPSYMAPEQVQGGPVDQRSDIYAIGLVLFELFTGSAPFSLDTPVAVALKHVQDLPPNPQDMERSIPDHVSRAILRCLEKDPAKRFQSVDELQAALLETPPLIATTLAEMRRRPWASAAVVLVTLITLASALALSRISLAEPQPGHDSATFAEVAAFRIAQSLDTEAAWQTFLKTYKQGNLAATAQSRLQRLQALAAVQPAPADAVSESPGPVATPVSPIAPVSPGPPMPPIPQRWIAALGTRFIPGGQFTMGNDSGSGDEKPAHRVRLDAFHIGRGEVTNKQYLAFLEDTGYQRPRDPGFAKNYLLAYPDLPVVNVSYYDALMFCKWASDKFGVPVQLPTEAEWEYAAMGGQNDFAYPWGDENPLNLARFEMNAPRHLKTIKLNTFPPNGFGLYNMSGNVSEWVQDFYSRSYYAISPLVNPTGPDTGRERVIRGGGWANDARELTVFDRMGRDPTQRSDETGFRIVVRPR